MKKLLAIIVLASLIAPALSAQGRWNFDVECGKLKPISLKTGVNTWKTWWYVVFEVENKTGADRRLNAVARVGTDTKKSPRVILSPRVLKAIAKKENLKLVNLLMPTKVKDNTKINGVLILADLDRLADRISFQVQGMASYIYKQGLKVFKEIREYRVTMKRIGDEYEVHKNPVKKLRPRWVVVKKEKIRG